MSDVRQVMNLSQHYNTQITVYNPGRDFLHNMLATGHFSSTNMMQVHQDSRMPVVAQEKMIAG